MRGVNIVRTLLFLINFHLLSAQNDPTLPEAPVAEIEDHVGQRDHHTFVAIVDILFRDNVKKLCSGAIIHDYVVLTAAHCFISPDTFPELTLTFVVIGTNKMYDTGYEQYLPVERYKVHPRHKGWTADLALVYTYMSMTLGKPGKIIMLAGEKIKNPIDTSVTVLSWGHAVAKKVEKHEHEDMVCKPVKGRTRAGEEEELFDAALPETSNNDPNATLGIQEDVDNESLRSGGAQPPAALEGAAPPQLLQPPQPHGRQAQGSNKGSILHKTEGIQSRLHSKNTSTEKYLLSQLHQSINEGVRRQGVEKPDDNVTLDGLASTSTTDKNSSMPLQGARRKIEHLRLTVEMFGFTNLQTCKQLVEKALPPIYAISDGGDTICYSSDDNYISEEDSGAPVVRHGYLLGITVGGVEVGSEHVAVAMRMSCFCGWIAANLPYGGNAMNCCKSCCSLALTTVKPRNGKKD